MSYALSPNAKQQFFTDEGLPANGYFLYTYAANSSTPRATKVSAGGSDNTNPIELDAQGMCDLWLDPTLFYKFILKTDADVTVWTVDDISVSGGSVTLSGDNIFTGNNTFEGNTTVNLLTTGQTFTIVTKEGDTFVVDADGNTTIHVADGDTFLVTGDGTTVFETPVTFLDIVDMSNATNVLYKDGSVHVPALGQDVLDLILAAGGGGAAGVPSQVSGYIGQNGSVGVAGLTWSNDVVSSVVFNVGSGTFFVIDTVPTIVTDISIAGPAVNGRDQAGAFSNNSWAYIYYIADSTGVEDVATIASAAPANTGGPTLPTGYDSWAYATAVRIDNSGNIRINYARGSIVYYDAAITYSGTGDVLANGTSPTPANIDISSFIPPDGVSFSFTPAFLRTSVGGGTTMLIYTGDGIGLIGVGATLAGELGNAGIITAFNFNQSIQYAMVVGGGGTTSGVNIFANAYRIPNGDF